MDFVVAGLGVDIISLDRLSSIVARSGDRFLTRVYTPAELSESRAHGDFIAALAGCFAAKEAVYKALGTVLDGGTSLADIQVTRGGRGEPRVTLLGRAGETAAERGIRAVLVSISWETDCAVACAIALANEGGCIDGR